MRAGDCDDTKSNVFPRAEERCDGLDENCNGEVDENPVDAQTWWQDGDGDGYGAGTGTVACQGPPAAVSKGGDCDDASASMHPYDLDGDGTLGNDEWDFDGTLAGATLDNFVGVRFGVITYAPGTDGVKSAAPGRFGNRDHSAAPRNLRYRYAYHFAAARNR